MIVNTGVVACALPIPVFLVIGIVFAFLKGKAAVPISGFNSLAECERAQYDTDTMAKDMRNDCFFWAFIMANGCFLSYAFAPAMAVFAYAVWLALLLNDVRMDPAKAFERYRFPSEKG